MKEQTQINPNYYKANEIEVIDFIEAYNLNFNLGNVVKYIARAGHKENEDYLTAISKAEWYLQREIKTTMLREAFTEQSQKDSSSI